MSQSLKLALPTYPATVIHEINYACLSHCSDWSHFKAFLNDNPLDGETWRQNAKHTKSKDKWGWSKNV